MYDEYRGVSALCTIPCWAVCLLCRLVHSAHITARSSTPTRAALALSAKPYVFDHHRRPDRQGLESARRRPARLSRVAYQDDDALSRFRSVGAGQGFTQRRVHGVAARVAPSAVKTRLAARPAHLAP